MATERVAIGTMVTALPRRRPQLVAQATTSLDRLSGGRMVLGLGLGVDSYGEYSAFDEPAADDRARGAALDAGIELLLPMLAGDAVPGAGGRVTTEAGVQQTTCPDLDRRAGGAPRRTAARALATDWRVWRWWVPTPGRPNTSAPRCAPATWRPARSTWCWSAAPILIPRLLPRPAQRGAFPEVLPGATSADALAAAAKPPG